MSGIVEVLPVALERSGHESSGVEQLSDGEDTHGGNPTSQERVEEALSAIAMAASLRTAVIEREAAEREAALEAEQEASLASFREALELKRKQKRDAELAHDQKVIEAVCAASLLEYTERQRIEKQLQDDEKQREAVAEAKRMELESTTTAARKSKTSAVQSVIDLKAKAHEAKQNARKAIEEYELKEKQRQEKLAQLAEIDAQRELELQLQELKRRQEEATFKRQESERRAMEAAQRAEMLRQSAVDAAKQMRLTTKNGMDVVLAKEEEARELAFANQLQAVQAKKDEATRKRMESERLAAEAAQRAERLRQQAIEAAKIMRSASKKGIESALEKEEEIRQFQYAAQLHAVQYEKDQATQVRMEKEAKANAALERAKSLQQEVLAASTPPPSEEIPVSEIQVPEEIVEECKPESKAHPAMLPAQAAASEMSKPRRRSSKKKCEIM